MDIYAYKKELEAKLEAVNSVIAGMGGGSPTGKKLGRPAKAGKRRKMSAAARAKIGAAQKLRWAKQKSGK